jgi:hypothetical protein
LNRVLMNLGLKRRPKDVTATSLNSYLLAQTEPVASDTPS